MKKPKCKVCNQEFIRERPLQVLCGFECTVEYARLSREKKDRQNASKARKEYREEKEKQKTLTDWLNETQTIFNRYIVARDGKKCISCGTEKPDIIFCAGHFRTRKAASQLRFNEDNVHTQCNFYCNSKLSGNIANYRPALIAKIGIDRVEALENNNEEKRWTVEELKELKRIYKEKLKQLSLSKD